MALEVTASIERRVRGPWARAVRHAEAIENDYRFYSFGDAMFIERAKGGD